MENTNHTFEELKELYFGYIKSQEDRKKIEDAYRLVEKKHKGQLRKSGEPYVHHLIEVAYILASIVVGPETIVAGLLHDVVEDTDYPLSEIEKEFGKDVAFLVDSVTKIQRMKLSKRYKENDEFEAEDHKKIFLGMAKDIRVIIIKLADRLHNMRTLQYLSHDRQLALSKETLDVYAPIADRLGMNHIKGELQDIALSYLEPEKYEEIKNLIDSRIKNRENDLISLKKRFADMLYEKKIPMFEISSRYKSVYSVYRKMYFKGRPFEQIYDIMAIRIITETEINCYEILGFIHQMYKPLLGRFKDYIAMPKPNMYQSLHTTILTGENLWFEVQIRTKEMDEVAEEGIAAHWRYKEGKNYNAKTEQKEISERLHWLKDFVNMSSELSDDAKSYMDSLKHEIFEANIYVFTPMGKVIDLPSGATPLDFAFRIHTKVFDSAVGALVNSVLVPLNTPLQTGDIVEIKTSKTSPGPNEGWLKIVTTNSAKNHIRKFLAEKNADALREDKIAKGRISILDAFRDRGIDEKKALELLNNSKLLEKFECETLDDLFIAISNRNPAPNAIIDFLHIKKKVEMNFAKMNSKDTENPILVKNAGKVMITLGSCCTPIPGDEITGYITKGKGITIHRTECPNVQNSKRLVEVFWNPDLKEKTYPVDLEIECNDRSNLIVDIMQIFSIHKVNVLSLNAKLHQDTMTSTISVTILVKNATELKNLSNVLINVTGVYQINRKIH
ncbi:MAG: bifunctional (p)ppGpp synthetase/guanosine-3',5'-bis(diphosphate) 3'-pyrophosphohydrolase [Erysipelotrichales bacterium]|nr:bifunctional (p)ppGpp synthetase/guanosine-3',5'-bis(diphosphate) 3'-pyrophosphohydrolase [Erysipelotrichales bacterium]